MSEKLPLVHARGASDLSALDVASVVGADRLGFWHIFQYLTDLRAARIGTGRGWLIWVEFQLIFVSEKFSSTI